MHKSRQHAFAAGQRTRINSMLKFVAMLTIPGMKRHKRANNESV